MPTPQESLGCSKDPASERVLGEPEEGGMVGMGRAGMALEMCHCFIKV